MVIKKQGAGQMKEALAQLLTKMEAKYKENGEVYHYNNAGKFEKILTDYNVTTVDDLFEGGLTDILTDMYSASFAAELKTYCTEQLTMNYTEGPYRRSFHSSNISDHATSILSLLLAGSLNETADVLTIIRKGYDTYYNGMVYMYGNKQRERLATSEFVNAKFTHLLKVGDEEAMAYVEEAIFGENNTAILSHTVIRSIIASDNRKAIEWLGQLLLAAQRQEGIRQAILESADRGTVTTLVYFMDLIKAHDLMRFSAVQRAVSTWTGLGYYVEDKKIIQKVLDLSFDILAHGADVEPLLQSQDAIMNYAALWSIATRDVEEISTVLARLIQGEKHQILATLYFISMLDKKSVMQATILQVIMAHDDLDILTMAMQHLFPISTSYTFYNHIYENKQTKKIAGHYRYLLDYPTSLLPRLEEIATLFTKPTHELYGKPFPWIDYELERAYVSSGAMLLAQIWGDQEYLLKLYDERATLTATQRENLLGIFVEIEDMPQANEFLVECLQDRGTRELALNLVKYKKTSLTNEQIQAVEQLLYLKSGATRQAILNILKTQPVTQICESAERLVKDGKQDIRLGGLSLLIEMKKGKKVSLTQMQEIITHIAKPTEKEQELIDVIVDDTSQKTLASGFGIFEPNYDRSGIKALPPVVDQAMYQLTSYPYEALQDKIMQLIPLIQERENIEYEAQDWYKNPITVLFANRYSILHGKEGERIENYPFADVWLQWKDDVQLTAMDCLMVVLFTRQGRVWGHGLKKEVKNRLANMINFDHINTFNEWFTRLPHSEKVDKIIRLLYNTEFETEQDQTIPFNAMYNAMVEYIATVPEEEWFARVNTGNSWDEYDYGRFPLFQELLSVCRRHVVTNEHFTRMFSIYRVLTEKSEAYARQKGRAITHYPIRHASDADVAHAHELGLVPIDACYLHLFDPENPRYNSSDLFRYDERKNLVERYPFLQEVYDTTVARIAEIELSRGELKTEVSHLANSHIYLQGVDYFARLLHVLKGLKLVRGYMWAGDYTKREVFSKMLENASPLEGETVEDLKLALKPYKITEEELLNAMMYTPKYIPLVSEYLGWNGLESAAWYFRAHTTDALSEESISQIQLYTNITANEFRDGVFAREWLLEVYQALGKRRFEKLYESAKYASEGSNHRRAQLFSDAALGKLKLKPLMEEVADKRNKDKLRCIGLIPLSKRIPLKDAYKRYQFIQNFLKESKQFGAQRRESEKLASQVAVENLARNLGDDVTRFMWRMEIFELNTILQYFEPIKIDDITLHLEANDKGIVDYVVYKEDKRLKTVPSRLKKHAKVVEITAIRKALREQQKRSRKSFEEAMEKGTVFSFGEMKALLEHPVLAPMLSKLYIVAEQQVGLLTQLTLADDAEVRIAHPYDLYASSKWAAIQHEVFTEKIVQPFKQVFRELYVVNEDERDRIKSARYAGHQIQPQKTVALLKNRGWLVSYDEGLRKVYYNEDIVVTMYAMADWFSPADIEAPTLEYVMFYNRRTGKPITLQEVPPLIFSEAMRDIDLVVSVAHVGGVDPEASYSTIETRAAIVRELTVMLNLPHISVEKQHVLIEGSLAQYSINLGSGTVHKVGGAMMPILAVQSQHRGRIFLPFADEDPRTAEIMSKIVMLSEDNTIKDPSILQMIRHS